MVRSERTQKPAKPASGQLDLPSNATGVDSAGAAGLNTNCAVGGAGAGGVVRLDGPSRSGVSLCLTVHDWLATMVATARSARRRRVGFIVTDHQSFRSSLAS